MKFFQKYGMVYSIGMYMHMDSFLVETTRTRRQSTLEKPTPSSPGPSFRVKLNHYDSGQPPLLLLSPASFDDLPWFNCDPCHYPGSSVCKKPMAQSPPRSKWSSYKLSYQDNDKGRS